jgi:hypothetical protein
MTATPPTEDRLHDRYLRSLFSALPAMASVVTADAGRGSAASRLSPDTADFSALPFARPTGSNARRARSFASRSPAKANRSALNTSRTALNCRRPSNASSRTPNTGRSVPFGRVFITPVRTSSRDVGVVSRGDRVMSRNGRASCWHRRTMSADIRASFWHVRTMFGIVRGMFGIVRTIFRLVQALFRSRSEKNAGLRRISLSCSRRGRLGLLQTEPCSG